MAKMNLDGLADRLKLARRNTFPEMSQSDVGKVLGRSGPCVGQWELGKSEPRLTDLVSLAGLYKVAVEWLLGVDNSASRATESLMLVARGMGANSVPLLSNEAIMTDDDFSAGSVQASRPYTSGTVFAWLVDTDAMARFTNGDIAIIERQGALAAGGIYLIRTEGSKGPTLRRCRFDQGEPIFAPDAGGFQTYNTSEALVLGRLREIVKHIPVE